MLPPPCIVAFGHLICVWCINVVDITFGSGKVNLDGWRNSVKFNYLLCVREREGGREMKERKKDTIGLCKEKKRKEKRALAHTYTQNFYSHCSTQMEMSNYNEIIQIILELLTFFGRTNEMAITENVFQCLWWQRIIYT